MIRDNTTAHGKTAGIADGRSTVRCVAVGKHEIG